jgi:transcriptional regulator with XRE-family HTH domain
VWALPEGRDARVAPVGQLIAAQRRRRGLSQAVLAGLVGRTEGWLSKVERGEIEIDRISVLLQIAEVLRVPASTLMPGTLPEPSDVEHSAALHLRLALSGHDILVAMFSDPVQRATPEPWEDLDIELSTCWRLVHAAEYVGLGERLPRLISSLELAARDPAGGSRGFAALAEVYQVTAAAMAKLHQTDVAWIAADRAVTAAERAGDELLAAAGDFRLAHAFLQGDRLQQAWRVVEVALQALRGRVDSDDRPEAISLWGALNLAGALIACRMGDIAASEACLAAASSAAARLDGDRNDYHTEFGPTNVALHEVAVAVELGRSGEALRLAKKIDAKALSAERRGRFLMDVARAHAQRRQADEAVKVLEEAEALTPEQVGTHRVVYDVLQSLIRGERRRPNQPLRELARRIGVLR